MSYLDNNRVNSTPQCGDLFGLVRCVYLFNPVITLNTMKRYVCMKGVFVIFHISP